MSLSKLYFTGGKIREGTFNRYLTVYRGLNSTRKTALPKIIYPLSNNPSELCCIEHRHSERKRFSLRFGKTVKPYFDINYRNQIIISNRRVELLAEVKTVN